MKSIVFRVAILVLPLFCAGLLLAAGQNAEQPKAPAKDEAALKDLFEVTCGACHGTDLVTSEHRTKEEWTGTVQSMVDKGAYLKKEDTPVLIDYLTAKFGPAKTETPAAK